MVWVKYKERHRTGNYTFWKQHRTLATARKLCRDWNSLGSPSEHLQILKHRKKKPDNLKKSKYKGIYNEKKKKKKK